MNFETAKAFFHQVYKKKNWVYRGNFELAKIDLELGDLKKAQEKYAKINALCNKKQSRNALFGNIDIAILKHEYEKAKVLLNKINGQDLDTNEKIEYLNLETLIAYFLEELDTINYNEENYFYNLLVSSSDDVLLEHIKHHQTGNYECPFLVSINLEELLNKVREDIKEKNGSIHGHCEKYVLTQDNEVGKYKDGTMTKDVCVITMLNTKEIVTMYPVKKSFAFDDENLMNDEGIRRKRKL